MLLEVYMYLHASQAHVLSLVLQVPSVLRGKWLQLASCSFGFQCMGRSKQQPIFMGVSAGFTGAQHALPGLCRKQLLHSFWGAAGSE